MKDYFGLTDLQYNRLVAAGINRKIFFQQIPIFKAENAPVSKINLLHVADSHGNFLEHQKTPAQKIAFQVYQNLPDRDKFQVLSYIDFLENGEDDEDDDDD